MAFVERKLSVISWDHKGKSVEGFLMKIAKQKYADGVGLRYLAKTRDGVMVEFPGTSDINSKLQPADIGCMIRVSYDGEDGQQVAQAGKSQRKLFTVLVDETQKLEMATVGDADIPF